MTCLPERDERADAAMDAPRGSDMTEHGILFAAGWDDLTDEQRTLLLAQIDADVRGDDAETGE